METEKQLDPVLSTGASKETHSSHHMPLRTATMMLLVLLVGAVLSPTGHSAVPESAAAAQAVEPDSLKVLLEELSLDLARLRQRVEQLESEQAESESSQLSLPAALAGRVVNISELPSVGHADSDVAIIEVTDYQCPFCRSHFRDTYPQIKRELVETGAVHYFVMDYPVPGHDLGLLAAEAAGCAREQGAFWRFHEHLFTGVLPADETAATATAVRLGLEAADFSSCLSRVRAEQVGARHRSRALGLGIKGTPTFLIGRLGRDSIVRDITVLHGIQTAATFQQYIDQYRPRQSFRRP